MAVRRLPITRISILYLVPTFLLGIALSFLVFNRTSITTISSKEPQVDGDHCNYTLKRVKGYEYIQPLLSVEPNCESHAFMPLKEDLSVLIDSLKKAGTVTQASVYFREFDHGSWISLNTDVQYHPASLMKVALLLSYLRLAEANQGLLKQKILFDKPDSIVITPQFYAAPTIAIGKEYTVHELLYYMIAYSDNNATWLLSRGVTVEQTKQLFKELGLPEPTLDNDRFTMTAKECALFFKAIYNVAYSGPEYSEYAAALLNACTFEPGFKKGFPPKTKMWHKFGEWRSPGQDHELHEAGVFYVHDKAYLLSVMTRGHDTDRLAQAISAIAQTTYRQVAP